MQHMQNMGPNLFMCNENSAYVMPCVTTHAVMSYVHHAVHACRRARHPYINVERQKSLMDMPCMPCMPAERYLSKITASHFSTLNMKIANQNVLKRILIAMHNQNKANCNENFRICAEEPVAPLYKR